MLPKYVIVCLPLQDLDGRGFGGLLSRMAVHTVAGMRKARELHNKEPRSGGSDRTAMRGRQGHATNMQTHGQHVPNSIGASRKNLVFHKMSF
jgi:hypothetical protein